MRTTIILFIAALVMILPSQAMAQNQGGGGGGGCGGLLTMVGELPMEDISLAEEADLMWMREEEKLARDVYIAMEDLWGLRVFDQIMWSEQNHMDVMLALIDKYGFVDPVGDNAPGVFNDPTLQTLFAQLLDEGGQSLIAALHVGATIEDLDINDLYGVLLESDNEDLDLAYQNLLKGSRNHLRAFVGLLEANGETYVPVYLSQEDFDAIISSPWEQGMVDADGEPISCGMGGGGGPGHRRGPRYGHRPGPGAGPGQDGPGQNQQQDRTQQRTGSNTGVSRQ